MIFLIYTVFVYKIIIPIVKPSIELRYFQNLNIIICVFFQMSIVSFAIFSDTEEIMTLREVIKDLCKCNNISVNKLESDLGFAKGYISKLDKSTPNSAKLQKIADYFNVTLDFLMSGKKSHISDSNYYINEETQVMAQAIFKSKELRLLFSEAMDAQPEDLKATHDILLALKRKERGND